MAERAPGGLLQRALHALAGHAEEARQAAIERTSAKYPDAYRSGAQGREQGEGRAQQGEHEEPTER